MPCSELRSDPTYTVLLDRLRERAREALGPGALIREHDRGGVVAEAGTRRVEYTLDGLADSCLDRLGVQVEELWSDVTGTGVASGTGPTHGHVVRVNGPLVEVEGLREVAMSEVLAIGRLADPGRGRRLRRGRGHGAGVRVHRWPPARRGRSCPRASPCRLRWAPACSVGSSTACSDRSPARTPG